MFKHMQLAVRLLLLLGCVIANAQPGDDLDTERPEVPAGDHTLASSTRSVPPTTTAGLIPDNATCISRTVNYMTHVLPQQCLRTDRSVANSISISTSGQTASSPSGDSGHSSGEPSTTTTPPFTGTVATTNLSVEVSPLSNTTSPADAQSTNTTANEDPLAASDALVQVRRAETEAESDSPLDHANFLSFDEWKKQNLAKAGQLPEHVGQERIASGDRRRPGIEYALDTLGEESEIDLDFSGFGGGLSTTADKNPTSTGASEYVAATQSSSASNLLRPKDAGKTCKERTNYASFDCAATVLKSNKECKSASSVLVENKDSYMLNVCAAQNKFFIIELCNDILVDTVVLANYEFFSSIFRHFRVSVSDRYPVKLDKWKDLGTFEARNTREVQAFLVENPLIWARYLRVEFLTHYGNEYYCPVSLLRVHGKTMMQEFRQQEELARGEIDEEPAQEAETVPAPSIAQEPLAATQEDEKQTAQSIQEVLTIADPFASEAAINTEIPGMIKDVPMNTSDGSLDTSTNNAIGPSPNASPASWTETTCAAVVTEIHPLPETRLDGRDPQSKSVAVSPDGSLIGTIPVPKPTSVKDASCSSQRTVSETKDSVSSSSHIPVVSSAHNSKGASANGTTIPPAVSVSNATTPVMSLTNKPSALINTSATASSNSTRATATSSSAALSQPPTQESFFKSISKRLQQLESNSTLSLQYIEEQSRILRDAFDKVEKRQISSTTNFLAHLNETVMSELNGFRQAYDQLWQGTVIELEGQREQYQREMLALSTRLTLVADELVWQKRMGIVQSTLLLLCLGLVLFARQSNGYLELPLVQQMMNKSQAALRAGWESERNSPSPPSRSPVGLFRRRVWRSSTAAENGNSH